MTSLSEQELDYSETISPGYRFRPTDTELIVEYLQKKVDGQPLPRNKIANVDLYKFHPDVLAATYSNYGDNEWYFFTPRDKRFRNGSVPNRSARGGYWKSVGSEKRIRRHDGVIIGRRKVLVFYTGKSPKGEKTDWIMYEFKLENAPPTRVPKMNPNTEEPNIRLDDSVLCRIYKKSRRSNYIRRYEAEEKYKYDEEINDARAEEIGDNHEITGGLEPVFHSDSPPASDGLLPLGDYDSPGTMADQPTVNYFPPPEGTYSDQPPPNDFPTTGSSYIYSDLPPSDDFLIPESSYSYSDQPPSDDFFLPGSNYSYSDQLEQPLARFAYDSYHHDHHNVEMTGSGEDRWINSGSNESPNQHQQSPYQHQPSPNQQHQQSAGSNISSGDWWIDWDHAGNLYQSPYQQTHQHQQSPGSNMATLENILSFPPQNNEPLQQKPVPQNNKPLPPQQAVQRCMYCGITEAPLWTEGPMGPKSLCNACGVRYMSGQLFPEF